MLKIIFIGDIVGYLGRETVKKLLPKIKRKYHPDIIIANAENLAHGKGITNDTIKEMKDAGINYFTSGNHIFSKKDALEILKNKELPILRPYNYPPHIPGVGEKVINISQKNILLVNLMGRVFVHESFDCPFIAFDKIYKKYQDKIDAIIVDLHAEATSEKIAFKHYVDGRAQVVIGTHTHVQTSDETISAQGTGYITDVGAVAPTDSILGVKKEIVLKSFLDQINYRHEFSRQGECELNAVIISLDLKNKVTTKIQRIKKLANIT